MRLVAVVLALTVTVVACGGKSQPRSDDETDGPFVNRAGFQPTAFTAKVTGQGRPVIFIPGLACPGEVWDDTVARLGNEIQAHVITLSGFAGTKPIKPPLVAKTRKELVRYIRSNHLKNPIIVGHSLGGFIAYWLAATAPDAVGGVVVVDAGPRYFADDEEARLLRNTWAQAGDDELPVALRNVFSGMTRDRRHIEPFIDQIAKSDRQTIGDAIYELVKTDITPETASITAPVLLVLADGGLQARYRKQAADVDHLEVVVMPKTGHFVMLDDPERFARTLSAFIAKQ
ncbi:MAG TPA: alpha/beta hydrolase [Kofleriaceae bacterium]|nr:alpha/beta hydrolase [Kofleriaceae bacterium]